MMETAVEWVGFNGDISGTPGAIRVDRLRNLPIATDAPQSGQVLTWNGTSWTPQFANVSGSTITVKSGATTVSTNGVANFVPGPGVSISLTNLGGETLIQHSADTTLLETRDRVQSGESTFCDSPSASGTTFTCELRVPRPRLILPA